MSVQKTHTGVVITRDGKRRLSIHETENSWVVKSTESYGKTTGYRWGAPNMRRHLILDSIKPIAVKQLPEGKLRTHNSTWMCLIPPGLQR